MVSHLDPVLLICPTKVLIEITGETGLVKPSIAGAPNQLHTESGLCRGKGAAGRTDRFLPCESTVTCP